MATAMERRSSYLILTLFLSALVIQIHAKNQREALDLLYKAKFFKNSNAGAAEKFFLGEASQAPVDDGAPVEIYDQIGLKEHDRIVRLPGQPARAQLSQYGGYVTIDKTAGRAFYYYFVEAPENKRNSLPLLLWLNGGPGCSSLGYGAMSELGPFRIRSDGKTLYENKFSWHHAANVLFLESPTGVGFSYSNTTSDYSTNGDQSTALNNYKFLVNWLERFPEYKKRDFYIAGESYAGHYVPQLAHSILSHNKRAKTVVNLKGIIIGNAVINDATDQMGMYEFFASHALVADRTVVNIKKYCDFSPNATTQNKQCMTASQQIDQNTGNLDIYNIYAPLCHNSNLTARPKKASVMNYDPCSDYYTYAYLNTAEVQKAMHANVTNLKYDWESCSDVMEGWTDSASTVIPLLREFMANGLRVWVYSGDVDGRVPITSSKYSIDAMKLPLKKSWYPWFMGAEVGGYAEEYEGGLMLATIRGAGHEVPSYQPVRALSLINHFLDGTRLPTFGITF